MKTRLSAYVLAAALGCAAFMATTAANAFVFTFDEFGHGTLGSGPNAIPLPGFPLPDPSSNIGVKVLTYFLPGHDFTAGDVGVCEFVACTNSLSDPHLSDIIRFTNATGDLTGNSADELIFYSDITPGDPNPPPADTGFPSNAFTGITGGPVIEVGDEQNNRFTYVTNTHDTFIGISDIPEPASLALLMAGLVGLAVMYRPRKNV